MARVKERGGVEIGSRSISCVAKNENPVPRSFNRNACYAGYICTQSLFILLWKERRLDDTVARVTHCKGRGAISFIPSMTPRVPQSNTNLLSPQKQINSDCDWIRFCVSRILYQGLPSVGEKTHLLARSQSGQLLFLSMRFLFSPSGFDCFECNFCKGF